MLYGSDDEIGLGSLLRGLRLVLDDDELTLVCTARIATARTGARAIETVKVDVVPRQQGFWM